MNTWNAPELAAAYGRHTTTLRGALRQALVARALDLHLPSGQLRILDVGGGGGHQAVRLAGNGHHVSILDLDAAMLDQARAAWGQTQQTGTSTGTVTFLLGDGEHAPEIAGTGYDAVLCHGVLMYLPDPAPMLRSLVACTRPGGLLSVLTKHAAALAMRPALERRPADALALLDASAETGRLGVASRGHFTADLNAVLAKAGATPLAWHGVRIFTDHLGDAPVDSTFQQWFDLEWRAGQQSPYRDVARLIHLFARATDTS
ncbi:methyltransferase domain-containing protein (plasmid) [Streptomyces viridifaciens]|nr:methyltransferase domain-containing protein [Streptomyces viridifaciens]